MDNLYSETTGRCRIRVMIRARGRDIGGYVVQRFADGIELLTDEVEGIWTGDRVEIIGEGFGPVAGVAQWRVPRRLGVKTDATSAFEMSLRELGRRTRGSSVAGKRG